MGASTQVWTTENETNPPAKPLTTRKFSKNIFINENSTHSCKAETFVIDVSEKNSAKANILFERDLEMPTASYEAEIGSLPNGVNITFSKNNDYYHNIGTSESVLELSIVNEKNSQKGNFNIPIIYTQRGILDSSVICQINVINQ